MMTMRSHASARSAKYAHSMLAVFCGKKKRADGSTEGFSSRAVKSSPLSLNRTFNVNESTDVGETETSQTAVENHRFRAFTDLSTAGNLEVHVVEGPNRAEFKQKLDAFEPDIVYFLGDCIPGSEELGPLELADGTVSTTEDLLAIFGDKLPQLVCLEVSATGKFGDALHTKGVPYIIFWKGLLTVMWADHFRQALIAILRSPCSQIWFACQFAISAFRFYRGIWKLQSSADGPSKNVSPVLLGEAPEKLLEIPRIKDSVEPDGSPNTLLKVQIYDEETDLPLLVLVETHGQDNTSFGALEDGLNALLRVEVIGMRLLHRVSASSAPSNMPLQARGVVTMRCDLCTSASSRISLLVAGSAQTCLDDQMLEYSIKKELLEKSKFVTKSGKNAVTDVRKSASVACGASVMEIRFRSSSWAVQVLRQLAPELSFRSLVALGIAGIQGFPVAAFQKDDVDRIFALTASSVRKNDPRESDVDYAPHIPSWLVPPVPSKKRQRIDSYGNFYNKSSCDDDSLSSDVGKDVSTSQSLGKSRIPTCNYVAAMKPIPRVQQNRDMPYAGAVLAGAHNTWSMKVNLPNGASGRVSRPNSSTGAVVSANTGLPIANKSQTIRAPSPAQMLSINPVPMKKHGCNRRPMHECSEDEFRKDVMQFLISRGHARLVPSTDVELFPDAVLNGKQLDLYNLYKEVVSRGGFHVGNGINWKGQVFSKMRNHTVLNKMTGVGNTLKKHYETYLLEYELAHDDVDGECCILCHSSAAGDWVNCGICGEWAHYGCDKRNGLGAFKEYAKTDGLEYVCPRCNTSNGRSVSGRRKSRTPANGYSRPSEYNIKTT